MSILDYELAQLLVNATQVLIATGALWLAWRESRAKKETNKDKS